MGSRSRRWCHATGNENNGKSDNKEYGRFWIHTKTIGAGSLKQDGNRSMIELIKDVTGYGPGTGMVFSRADTVSRNLYHYRGIFIKPGIEG
jgi:hypothetical protein